MNLEKALKTLEYLRVINYNKIWLFYDFIIQNPNSVVSKKWTGSKYDKKYEDISKDLDDFDIFNKEYWITYDNYRTSKIFFEDNKLFVRIKVNSYITRFNEFAGHSYKEEFNKFEVLIELPTSFLEHFREEICFDLSYHFEDKYEEMLLKRKKDWVKKQIKNL